MPAPAFLFAPGAGAPSSSAWMQRFARRFEELGTTQCLDYPYQTAQRKRPDPLPALITAHQQALHALRARVAGPLVLAGKSMGSRVGCHVSLSEPVSALVCFGYPLLGSGNVARKRDEVLKQLTTPILFIQGTRDALCPLPLLEEVRAQMAAVSELMVIDTGDHSLEVTRRFSKESGQQQADIETAMFSRIRAFIERVHGPLESQKTTVL